MATNFVTCQICGGFFKSITNTHLANHGISVQEYQKKYPDSPINIEGLAYSRVAHLRGKSYKEVYGEEKSKTLKLSRKEDAINQFKNPDQRKLRKITSSVPMTEEGKKKLSESMTEHGGTNYRRRALDHYGNKCQKCECKLEEKELVVHHKDLTNINSKLGNHCIDNLMVLCKPCHSKLHNELSKTAKRWTGLNHIERGVHYIFKGLNQEYGLDLSDVNFKDTPKRVARAFAEIFEGVKNTEEQITAIINTSFPSTNDEMVVVKDIRCYSMCPHHLLPVEYCMHVGYIPKGRVLGISKLARIADILAKRPVIQETFTVDVVKALQKLEVQGAMCLVNGIHYCMRMRGIHQANSTTTTSAIYGAFNKIEARSEFLAIINRSY